MKAFEAMKERFRIVGCAVIENAGPILDTAFIPLCWMFMLGCMLILSLIHWSLGILCLILILQLAILAKI